MALEDIVNVVVSIGSATVSQKGFGTPLVFGYHTAYSDRVRTYKASSWSSAMIADGFDVDEPVYLGARALMNQSPRPKEFKIGRRSTAETQVLHVTPIVGGTGTRHAITVESGDGQIETAEYIEIAADTVALIVAGLVAALATLTAAVTATDSATHVVVTGDTPNVLYSFYGATPLLTVTDHTVADTAPTTGIVFDLEAIWATDSEWYGLCLVSGAPAVIEVVADWVESKPIIFVPQTPDQATISVSTTDIASSLGDQAYARTMVMYHSRLLQFAGIAWIGKMLPYEPGAATWKFKTLRGVNADKLTANQETNATNKNLAYYSAILGTNIAGEGAAADGTFLDLTQLSDWFAARSKENVFGALAANPKVPFTDEGGGAMIYGSLKNVIELGQRNKSIDTDPESWGIDVPLAMDVPAADRAARKWSGVTCFFRATGAVHSVDTINVTMNI